MKAMRFSALAAVAGLVFGLLALPVAGRADTTMGGPLTFADDVVDGDGKINVAGKDLANVTLPDGRDYLNNGLASHRTPKDFGAVCDIATYGGSATWAAGGTSFTPNNSITPAAGDVGKKLVVYGAGSGGNTYVGTITGIAGAAWTVSPALTQASGLSAVYGAQIATAQSGAGSYAPGDPVTPTGGTITGGSQPVFTVKYTKLVSATVAAGGTTSLPNGSYTVTNTTGVGNYFKIAVTVTGGTVTGVGAISVAGAFATNPTSLTAEPVQSLTGSAFSGTQLSIKMGVAQVLVTQPGGYSVVPSNPVAQGSTSGSGTGATFTLTFGSGSSPGHYGQWYYGTNDATALGLAVSWAIANQGTVRLAPKQKCATGTTLTLNGNYTTIEGESSGVSEGNRFPMAINSALFWVGAAGEPIVEISTPDGERRVLGNALKRLALIGANRAGFGLRFKTAANATHEDVYFEQFTNAALELNTNTNAIAPTDTQVQNFHGLNWNQIGSNGVEVRLTGDNSVGTGNASANQFYDSRGYQGNDTAFELRYADTNSFYNTYTYAPSYIGALYQWDLGGIPTFYSYSTVMRGVQGQIIVRGNTSSGVAGQAGNAVSSRNLAVFTGDPSGLPIIERGGQLPWSTSYNEHNQVLTSQLMTGLASSTLYTNRGILDNSLIGLYVGDDILMGLGTTAQDMGWNVKWDTAQQRFVYVNTAAAFLWRNVADGTFAIRSAASGTAGTEPTFVNHMTYTAGAGTQIGSPTGGDKGSGTVNVQGTIYDNGTAPRGTAGTGLVRGTASLINSPTISGTNSNTPLAAVSAAEFHIGRGGAGTIDAGMTTGDLAFQYGGVGGGFRHYLATWHDAVTAGNNQYRFYCNTSGTAGGSSAPGTGNILCGKIDGDGDITAARNLVGAGGTVAYATQLNSTLGLILGSAP